MGTFKDEQFVQDMMHFAEVDETFAVYSSQFAEGRGIPLNDGFGFSKSAVKSERKHFKSVLKLDKNFHVYVHGKRDYIEKGFDAQRGMNFYKLFFESEKIGRASCGKECRSRWSQYHLKKNNYNNKNETFLIM